LARLPQTRCSSKARILLEISHVYHGFYPDGLALPCCVAAIVIATVRRVQRLNLVSRNSQNRNISFFPDDERI